MFYRLADTFALRAWKFVNHGLYERHTAAPLRVDDKTFDVLLACDGEHDLPESEMLASLQKLGIVEPCAQGEAPCEWSRYRRYDHRFVPAMNLMLTGKCNYNCRHCFNAAENAERMAEWAYADVLDLLDQAEACGFHSITLTGGEPMLHPRFLDIVRAIYDRGMVLEKLTTNGYFISEEVLEEFARIGCSPKVKISFDGVGWHDWMRGAKGAEARTLAAFELCRERGFETFAQVQVFRRNLGSLRETLAALEGLGVKTARLIRTTAVPRWQKSDPNGSLSIDEYFSEMLSLAEWYLAKEHEMDVVMWMYLVLSPRFGTYSVIPARNKDGVYRPTRAVCPGNRTMMAVTCEGDVVPCLQMSGYITERGYVPENLHERRLRDILMGGKWLDEVCANSYTLRRENPECDACPWFGHCAGGCRALAILGASESGRGLDYYASDPMACAFFKGGWYDRVREQLSAYKQL